VSGAAPRVRPWREDDLPAIARLYHDTVHAVNARDYTPEQIAAWAPRVEPEAFWRRRFATRLAFVAAIDGAVAGFCELEPPDHVDCFYVHHAWQRRGVGAALMRRLLEEAAALGAERLRADVSVTARAFFERQGFAVARERTRRYRGQAFRQFLMERRLGAAARGGL
jgi:putative acetyltransferase